jgi:hypothetical protein
VGVEATEGAQGRDYARAPVGGVVGLQLLRVEELDGGRRGVVCAVSGVVGSGDARGK